MSNNSENQCILVVDDEPDVLQLVSSNLKSAGFDVIKAGDGVSALAQARDTLPSLIVLDLMLPEMSGLEVCRVLKKEPSTNQIPIIMLTGKAEVADRIVGLELGADDYLTKPFSPRELVLRVKSVLRRGNETPEIAERMRANDIAVVGGLEPFTLAFRGIDVEVIRPELDHHLVELAAAERGAEERGAGQFLEERPVRVFVKIAHAGAAIFQGRKERMERIVPLQFPWE